MISSSLSPYSHRAVNPQFAGQLSQKKIDKYKQGLGIPDWVAISPENTVSKVSVSRMITIGFPSIYAGLFGFGYMIKHGMNDGKGKDLFSKIRDSKEPITAMVTTTFLTAKGANEYVNAKSDASLGTFPYIFRFNSPTSKNKAITVITNAFNVNTALQDVNPFFNVKSPFSNQNHNASFSSDDSGADRAEELEQPVSASVAKEPETVARTSSEDDQPVESPFHNAASKLRTAPPPPKPRRVGTASDVLTKPAPPAPPNPRRVKTASDDDGQPFNSPFHNIQLHGAKRALPAVPIKKNEADEDNSPFKD